ncbi:hypothetical protein J2Z83_003857 [Virgibacillus natechei]|uniref:Uncharacterized protein n=1 Tax=Virgibacillus natechei TaxID=1216297 RepID=A0ABS4IL61_9BACI|nr:hypothetical protein [Virgibacillus natechei]MBP1971702.1 hypothetical protein [Virgibacillus natechei]UZD12156.1 hypothetical protein OLD84_14635 [Virgibacillus natechei]
MSNLLHLQGIESVILEKYTREQVLRAGVLESDTVGSMKIPASGRG